MTSFDRYNQKPVVSRYVRRRISNSLTYLFVSIMVLAVAVGIYRGGLHLVELQPEAITIAELPSALALSSFRMLASFLASIVFAFGLGLAAARTRVGERTIIPILDILQSVPVVGFFPAAISFFIGLSGGHRIGIELAASFLIFTSMAWNMAFAVYEAVKMLPQDQMDAVDSFRVRGALRFWKVYLPVCIPRLVYNSILSWSNGWYFLVACEIIAVGPVSYHLPGIGSFLARAAEHDEIQLVLWGLAALTGLILATDLFVWRPASVWAEKFKQEDGSSDDEDHYGLPPFATVLFPNLRQKTRPFRLALRRILRAVLYPILWVSRQILAPIFWELPKFTFKLVVYYFLRWILQPVRQFWIDRIEERPWLIDGISILAAGTLTAYALYALYLWLQPPWPELVKDIPWAIAASTARLVTALLISLAWVLPVVFLTWNRPSLRQRLATVAQVGASLPAIALFPLIIVVAIKKLGGGMEIASVFLLLTGMQWYLLFNALGGAATIPNQLTEATNAFRLSPMQKLKHLVFPAIRPSLITGAITAWGGGWNALVVAEYVTYKNEVQTVPYGIGALLNRAVYQLGDERAMAICIAAMVGWILLLNTVFWRPLYESNFARYKMDG